MQTNPVTRSILKMKQFDPEADNADYNDLKVVDRYLIAAGISNTLFTPLAPDGKRAQGAVGSS